MKNCNKFKVKTIHRIPAINIIRTNFFLLAIFALVLTVSACFSPWTGDGDMGTFTLSLGGSGTSRAGWPLTPAEIAALDHTILLSDGPGPDQTRTGKGATPITFTVRPGYWTISVKSSLNGVPAAEGSVKVQIVRGNNPSVSIQMGPPTGSYAINGVAVSPAAITVTTGLSQDFTATVLGTGTFSVGVTWSLTGNSSLGTTLTALTNNTARLVVSGTETVGNLLIITATSVTDKGKTGSATVTVSDKENAIAPSLNYTFNTTPSPYKTGETATTLQVTVPNLSAMTSQPGNISVTYQWYWSDAATGGTLTAIIGGSGSVTASPITYTPPTTGAEAGTTKYYYLEVTHVIFDNLDTGDKSVTEATIRKPITVYETLTGTVTIIRDHTDNKINETLRADISTIGNPSGAVSYQWKRDTINITGATNQTYKIAAGDAGTYAFSVVVSYAQRSGSVTGNLASMQFGPEYGIYTIGDLNAIPNGATNTYVLCNDISGGANANASANYNTGFMGTFDGNGKTIELTSLSSNSSYLPAGIFRRIGGTGVVKNLKITGTNVTVTPYTNNAYTGAVAGENAGMIQNVVSEANLNVTYNYTTSVGIGGIAGYNNGGTIQNCYTTGNIIQTAGTGHVMIGGIVGDTGGIYVIKYCWSSGNKTGLTSNSYAGGIVGYLYGTATFSNCVVLGLSTLDGGGGYCGRIFARPNTYPGVSNNYADSAVIGKLNGVTLSWTTYANATDKDGATVGTINQSLFTTTAGWPAMPTTSPGVETANPWWWDTGTSRPRLWFE